jgi:hypothetical protein
MSKAPPSKSQPAAPDVRLIDIAAIHVGERLRALDTGEVDG